MNTPYTFDGQYSYCYTHPSNCADKRHVYTIYELLRTGLFSNALEVGTSDGATSTAFVEAAKVTPTLRYTCCDIQVAQATLMVVPGDHFYLGKSVEILRDTQEPFDFIHLDGDHTVEGVAEELAAIDRTHLLAITGHDTSASVAGYKLCEGAELLRRTVMYDWGWYCIEDNLRRDGEETHRGLFFATPSPGVYKRALSAFRRHCWEPQGVLNHA